MGSQSDFAEIYRLETPEQALALLHPFRADILRHLADPASASEVGRKMGEPPQKINYHLKALEKVGLARRCGTRQVKNLVEVLYRAAAKTFVIPDEFGWSDELKGRMKDQGALRQLIQAAERIQRDALKLMDLADASEETPSAVVEAELSLPDEATRQAFLQDYAEAVRGVAAKYRLTDGKEGGEGFRAVLAVYPQANTEQEGNTNGD